MTVEVTRRAKILDIKRVRMLPFPGRVLVNEGQQVHPGDILAEAKVPADLVFVDVSKGLGVPPQKSGAYLLRKIGETLEEGDVLAQYEGLFTRLVRMPLKGLFLDFVEGRAVFSTGFDVISLGAAMMGIVETVIPGSALCCQQEGVFYKVSGEMVGWEKASYEFFHLTQKAVICLQYWILKNQGR